MFKLNFPKLNLKAGFKLRRFFGEDGEVEELGPFILPPDTPADDEEIPDIFGRGDVAKKIAHAIWRSKGQMNFLIAGEWGIGKSSVLNLIKKELKKHRIRSIWFSPWKYSGSLGGANSISRAFLAKLAEEIGKPHEVRDLYIKKVVEKERNMLTQVFMLLPLFVRYVLYWGVIYLLLNLLISISSVRQAFDQIDYQTLPIKDKFSLLIAASALLALPPFGEYFVGKIRQRGEVEKASSPELFEQKFYALIDNSIRVRPLQRLISLWEETVSGTFLQFLGEPLTDKILYKCFLSPLRTSKLVVFVDDLDRCKDENEVRQFLTGMKTFLEHKNVYYVIAADVEKLREIAGGGKEPEFLRKIIQVDWNVPNMSEGQIKKYVQSLLREAEAPRNLVDVDQLVYLFSINPNPRRIKYYLRRLLFMSNIIES